MTKRRAIAIAAFVIWVLLFLVAMIDGDLFPTLVKAIAGAVSIGLLTLVIPVSSNSRVENSPTGETERPCDMGDRNEVGICDRSFVGDMRQGDCEEGRGGATWG